MNYKLTQLNLVNLSKAILFNQNTFTNKFSNSPASKWPETWKKQNYKSYQRLDNFLLDLRNYRTTPLADIIFKRKSDREFCSEKISGQLVADILFTCCGINRVDGGTANRVYPSAGARYPIETYIVIRNNSDIQDGLYHYGVKQNNIALLLKGDLIEDICSATDAPWLNNANIIIILTCVLDRSYVKYGDRGYRFALLEAGHIAQNFYLYSTEQQLRCCGIGGFIDNKIHELLDIDDEKEFAVYLLAIGK